MVCVGDDGLQSTASIETIRFVQFEGAGTRTTVLDDDRFESVDGASRGFVITSTHIETAILVLQLPSQLLFPNCITVAVIVLPKQ
jgi:hypothetical protein